ncbi:hypothetical protein ElyMa_002912800 [Elysia marginata]|uniref:Uncharacterized protein n=1 Tax=Elysia marginata TaxID=1093978 RepID=A0AAV4I3D7_9GAST|nr:hypothetical protein ElyMa_002912800 [Elysia marginata]
MRQDVTNCRRVHRASTRLKSLAAASGSPSLTVEVPPPHHPMLRHRGCKLALTRYLRSKSHLAVVSFLGFELSRHRMSLRGKNSRNSGEKREECFINTATDFRLHGEVLLNPTSITLT